MNYVGLLTKEEKAILCEIITGKEFKELFKKNEQDFSKIQSLCKLITFTLVKSKNE